MGEFSKLVGEHGENLAGVFLDLIGWKPRMQQFDLPCSYEHHDNSVEHGVDAYYHYKSPLIDDVLDHVIVSVKYSADGYGKDYKQRFKKSLKQLLETVECFDRTDYKHRVNNSYVGVSRSTTCGLLIWFHGNVNENQSIIDKIKDVRFSDDLTISRPIVIIDKRRMEFVSESILLVMKNYGEHKIDFLYQNTGNNLSASEKITNGNYLPVQMISSGCLVFRVQPPQSNDVIVCICCDESFSKDAFEKTVGLAQELTLNLPSKVEIYFPDFQPEKHNVLIDDVKMLFGNRDFSARVNVKGLRLGIF